MTTVKKAVRTFFAKVDHNLTQFLFMQYYPNALKWNRPVSGELQPWNIWMEGFHGTGCRGRAMKINSEPIIATCFDEAVQEYMTNTPDPTITKYTEESFESEEAWEHRRSNWKIWGCDLFSNETAARMSYG